MHVRSPYNKEHNKEANELEAALRHAETKLKVSEPLSLPGAVVDELWSDPDLKRLEAEERVFVIRPKKGTATAPTNIPAVVRLVSDETSDMARVQAYLYKRHASVECEDGKASDGVGNSGGNATPALNGMNIKIKMLLLGAPGRCITGTNFKPKWRERYGTALVLAKSVKLKKFLEDAEALGACRLEMRPASNGSNSLIVHAPCDEEGQDQAAFETTAEVVYEVGDRVQPMNKFTSPRHPQPSKPGQFTACSPHSPTTPVSMAAMAALSAKSKRVAKLSERNTSVEPKVSNGEGGTDKSDPSTFSSSSPSPPFFGNVKQLEWKDLKVGDVVGEGSFGLVNDS